MTLNDMKKYYLDEATELGMASEQDIERLCVWLEANGYDADLAWRMWDAAVEEIEYMVAEFC
jgi:hypothetical protein